jgi:hypothetical protein
MVCLACLVTGAYEPQRLIVVKAAKRGAVPHLAVATEQGRVYIWDASKREALEQG